MDSGDEHPILEEWSRIQTELKETLQETDDMVSEEINYVGGVDISFIKGNEIDACACYVILSYPELKVVHQEQQMIKLTQPYIPGFLAFREVDFLVELFQKCKDEHPEIVPQVIFVDGNGILHPKGFGLASHLGVLCDIPTIGIGKTLLHVDGITKDKVKAILSDLEDQSAPLVGDSGKTWGALFLASPSHTVRFV
jgi:deoxyinosine 3'endonuclease (endonuclease V)